MGNPFAWMELTTIKFDGAKEFYGKVFDWKIAEMPMPDMNYAMIDTGSEPGGGIMPLPDPNVPVAWTIYIRVDDIQAAVKKITEARGCVHKQPWEIPEVGWIAIVADPQGAVFGLWQPKKDS